MERAVDMDDLTRAAELAASGDWHGAHALYVAVLPSDANRRDIITGRMRCLLNTGRADAALALAQAELRPDDVLGPADLILLADTHRCALLKREAAAIYRHVLRCTPSLEDGLRHVLYYRLASCLFAIGCHVGGYYFYEARIGLTPAVNATNSALQKLPRWTGRPVGGDALAVYSEQGDGDMIMTARYLPAVKRLAPRLVVYANPSLLPLLSASYADIEFRSNRDSNVSDVRIAVPNMSLMRLVGEAGGQPVPYLRVPGEAPRRERRDKPRIGVVWNGSKAHVNDRYRSMPFTIFRRLLGLFGGRAAFFALSPRRFCDFDGQAESGLPLTVAGDEEDFTAMAGRIQDMDLVISIDSAPVHLAGALSVPVWNLLSYDPDWRWGCAGAATRWYPGMRLYRQSRPGDWIGVMNQVTADLARYLTACPVAR